MIASQNDEVITESIVAQHEKHYIENVYQDQGDPHQVALEDDIPQKVNKSVYLALFFIGLTFPASTGFTLSGPATLLVDIGLEIEGSTDNITWIVSGTTIAAAITFLIAGKFSDIYGRRHIFLIGQAFVLVGCIICSAAQNLSCLIAGNVIIGWGGGTVFVTGYSGIVEMVPNKYRFIGLAFTEICLVVPNVFCALIARAFQANTVLGWRWLYILSALIIVVAMTGAFFTYYPPSHPLGKEVSRWQKTKEIDYLGIILFSSGVAVFLIPIIWGGTTYAWSSAGCIAPLVIGIVMMLSAFAWGFSGIPKDPLFPLRLFSKIREFTVVLFVVLVAGFVLLGMNTMVPQQYTDLYTTDGITAGIYQLAPGFGTAVGGIVWPLFAHKISRWVNIYWQMIIANGTQTLFYGLMALETPTSIGMALTFQFFAALCFGYFLIAGFTTISLHVSQSDLGLAGGQYGAFRCVGFALGGSLLNTIATTKAESKAAVEIVAAATASGMSNASEYLSLFIIAFEGDEPSLLNTVPGMTQEIIDATWAAFKDSYNYGFRIAWIATIPFCAVAFILCFFIADPTKYMTHHIAVHMEKEIIGGKKEHNIDAKA